MGEVSPLADVGSPTADLFEDVEVILEVLDRAVIRFAQTLMKKIRVLTRMALNLKAQA
jgi:hypothetical protein